MTAKTSAALASGEMRDERSVGAEGWIRKGACRDGSRRPACAGKTEQKNADIPRGAHEPAQARARGECLVEIVRKRFV